MTELPLNYQRQIAAAEKEVSSMSDNTESSMSDNTEVYAVLSGWVPWKQLFGAQMTAEGGIPVEVQTPDNSIGFVPVFETHAQAQAVVDQLRRPAHIVSFSRKGYIPSHD